MAENTAKTYDMVLTRVFAAPPEQVWRAWAEEELVKRWWGPGPFTCPLARMDFREGGTSLVAMRTPDGHDLYNSWTYTKLVPYETIELVQHFSDAEGRRIAPASIGLPESIPAEVPHRITLKPLDGGRTEMTVAESGYPDPQIVEMSKMGMEQCLDKMAGIFRTKENRMEMKLELVPVPVSDVDRAKAFYADLIGFNVDLDVNPGNGLRVVQLTPPGSACSIVIGKGMPEIDGMAPGTVKAVHLVVKDVAQSREELIRRGVQVDEIEDHPQGVRYAHFSDPDGNTWLLQEMPWRAGEFQ